MRFNNYSEQDLIDEFYQCSNKAFDDLFEMRIKRFILICRSMSVQTYYVNDIISTSYLKVKKYVSEPHQKKNIKNIDDYNNKVIKNVVIDFFKKESRYHTTNIINFLFIHEEFYDSKDIFLKEKDIKIFFEILEKKLSKKEYNILYMKYKGISTGVIAERLGGTSSAISHGLNRAKDKAQIILKEYVRTK